MNGGNARRPINRVGTQLCTLEGRKFGKEKVRFDEGCISPMISDHIRVPLQGGSKPQRLKCLLYKVRMITSIGISLGNGSFIPFCRNMGFEIEGREMELLAFIASLELIGRWGIMLLTALMGRR